MRLNEQTVSLIKEQTKVIIGDHAVVTLFGSRVDDDAKGGDLDLMVEVQEPLDNPAVKAATLAAKVSKSMGGRKVDVLLKAPNLKTLPIHEVAKTTGILLW